jgi:pyruvate ferredoxin oxidoreductase beta subunit
MNLIEIAKSVAVNEKLTSGHRMCPGCGAALNVKLALAAIKDPLVVINATSCLEVATTIYPDTSWNIPWIHNAFENASATASGVIEAYHAVLKKTPAERPAWAKKIRDNVKFVVIGGDGGSYDIGLQSLSGALERGHQFLYICYDNGAYMNTGNQRSGATPRGANTMTSLVGKLEQGKNETRKDLTSIVEGHHINYVAQASLSDFNDLTEKVKKAIAVEGPSFINLISPCQRSWGFDPSLTVQLAKMAVETNYWPLYEVDHGKFILNYIPKEKVPIAEWFKMQKRFKHLLEPQNAKLLEDIQKSTDEQFAKLKKRAECGY